MKRDEAGASASAAVRALVAAADRLQASIPHLFLPVYEAPNCKVLSMDDIDAEDGEHKYSSLTSMRLDDLFRPGRRWGRWPRHQGISSLTCATPSKKMKTIAVAIRENLA